MDSTSDWHHRIDDPDVALGAHVNSLRFLKHATQSDLGRVLGVSQSSMSKKLRGEVALSFGELLALADFFDLAVEDLIPPRYARTAGQGTPAGRSRYAIRDSNPEPADLGHAAVVIDLATWRAAS